MSSACLYGICCLCCAKSGPMLSPCWAHVGPMLAHVEPSWELCRGHVWVIYVERILRCQFFLPTPRLEPKTTQKPMFFNIAKMKSVAPEGPETP